MHKKWSCWVFIKWSIWTNKITIRGFKFWRFRWLYYL